VKPLVKKRKNKNRTNIRITTKRRYMKKFSYMKNEAQFLSDIFLSKLGESNHLEPEKIEQIYKCRAF